MNCTEHPNDSSTPEPLLLSSISRTAGTRAREPLLNDTAGVDDDEIVDAEPVCPATTTLASDIPDAEVVA